MSTRHASTPCSSTAQLSETSPTNNIGQAYAEQELDDASVAAEAAVVAARLEQVEATWREAKTRTDRYLTADGASFVSDDAAAAIDTTGNTYIGAKQDIYQQAAERSNEINAARARIAKQAYYRELVRERSFGGGDFTPSNTAKMTKADRAMFGATAALTPTKWSNTQPLSALCFAKRSKARAHYNAGARQRTCRTRSEVFSTTPWNTGDFASPTTLTLHRTRRVGKDQSVTATAPPRRSWRAPRTTSAGCGIWWPSTTKAGANTPRSNT